MDERGIISRCRSGEPAALRAFVEEHYDRVYRVARTLVAVPHDAEDLTQDVFTGALRSIRSFRGESGIFTWLVSILRHTWLNRRRKLKRMSRKEIRPGDATTAADGAKDDLTDLHAVFGRLEEEERLILELYHFEELKYGEIGRVLEVPVGTVKSRLHTARQKLRNLLEGSHAV